MLMAFVIYNLWHDFAFVYRISFPFIYAFHKMFVPMISVEFSHVPFMLYHLHILMSLKLVSYDISYWYLILSYSSIPIDDF